MEEWKEYKLGDCVEAVIDNRGKSAPTKPLGEFPLLEINSIGGYYPNYSVIRKYVDKVGSGAFGIALRFLFSQSKNP